MMGDGTQLVLGLSMSNEVNFLVSHEDDDESRMMFFEEPGGER